MEALLLYKPNSDHERVVLDYLRDFAAQTGYSLKAVDADSKEGEQICRLYDVVEYPTLLAVMSDGHLQNMWRGLPLPRVSEVSYFSRGEQGIN
jgi:hypothetical protein